MKTCTTILFPLFIFSEIALWYMDGLWFNEESFLLVALFSNICNLCICYKYISMQQLSWDSLTPNIREIFDKIVIN